MRGSIGKHAATSAAALLLLAAVGCGWGNHDRSAPPDGGGGGPAQTPGTTVASPQTAASAKTGSTAGSTKDVRFSVTRRGLTGVDPSNMKVSCGNIDYPVLLTDASAPFHWKIRKDSRLPDVYTVPAEGDLAPGQRTVVTVKGTYEGKSGAELSVYVWSEESTQTSSIQMYCR